MFRLAFVVADVDLIDSKLFASAPSIVAKPEMFRVAPCVMYRVSRTRACFTKFTTFDTPSIV